MMHDVWIAGAARTAIGKFGGSLKYTALEELGSAVIREALQRSKIPSNQADEVIMGCVLTAGHRQNPARLASVLAGIPVETCAWTVNMVCGSGLKAIADGAQSIRSGEAGVVVAGGMEHMSAAPFLLPEQRWGRPLGNASVLDSILQDALQCGITDVHMGVTAENIAKRYGISREEQDAYAAESQRRAAKADFSKEIVPMRVKQGKDSVLFDQDEFPRPDTTVEALSRLKPAFQADGSVTAGNSSGINDGAAVIILCSTEKLKELSLTPLARLIAVSKAGIDPAYMGLGPVPATQRALAKSGWAVEDLDLIEVNEAFACQAIAVIRELNLPPEKTNVKGGAIALGHPVGCSGARILTTLFYSMQERNAKRGLAALCVGGGMGLAALVERV